MVNRLLNEPAAMLSGRMPACVCVCNTHCVCSSHLWNNNNLEIKESLARSGVIYAWHRAHNRRLCRAPWRPQAWLAQSGLHFHLPSFRGLWGQTGNSVSAPWHDILRPLACADAPRQISTIPHTGHFLTGHVLESKATRNLDFTA